MTASKTSSKLRLRRAGLGVVALLLSSLVLTIYGTCAAPPPRPDTAAQAHAEQLPPPPLPSRSARSAPLPPGVARSAPAPATWTTLRTLRQRTPAQLVHQAALSKSPHDFFAAQIQLQRCLDKGVSQALVAHAAPSAPEAMKRTIKALEDLCQARGDRRQLAYVAQSWAADSPERRAYEAQQRQDHAGVVDYVLSTGSADFAAELLPGHITLELLEARSLLPPLKPEAADLEGMGPLFDLASVSRLRDQFALSRVVAIWSCTRLGTCVEEAQLAYQCHALNLCVDDLRDFPEQKVFNRSPVDPNGSPSFAWVSRARWAQIQQAVNQLLGGLR
ncbi:hypothetical protein [Pelomonas sp. BJYL3]|uniref:hypothetical protein n=1 Tax=Pelomonas sp. BJYL3 TaxID=2976697 RepID=UPI0022B3FA16|nr:hypothetical protein [Pelomonas sp. BJYL3]